MLIRCVSLQVKEGEVEYNTGDKVLHSSRKNGRTRLKIKLDPSLTNNTNTELNTNMNGEILFIFHSIYSS